MPFGSRPLTNNYRCRSIRLRHVYPPAGTEIHPQPRSWTVPSSRAGTPAAIVPGARSPVTTELAPITQRSPIVTPLVTTQLTPNQQLEPIRTGPLLVKPCQVIGFSG